MTNGKARAVSCDFTPKYISVAEVASQDLCPQEATSYAEVDASTLVYLAPMP